MHGNYAILFLILLIGEDASNDRMILKPAKACATPRILMRQTRGNRYDTPRATTEDIRHRCRRAKEYAGKVDE